MITNYVVLKTTIFQKELYSKLNNFSQTHKTMGRFCSIPVSVLDVAIETSKAPIGSIECLAMAAINLVGLAFSKKFTLKDALINAEFTLISIVVTPVKLATAPLKVIYQLFAILINPEKVQSIVPILND